MPRFYCPAPLATGELLDLPPGPARHVQVLRMQPGQTLSLFGDGAAGGSFEATIERMGRSDVAVRIGAHQPDDPRAAMRPVHLAVGMPANDRMDWLIEKATELGEKLRVKLRSAREKMGDVQEIVADRAKAAARATDDFVHDNPWKAIGIAAGVGFLLGLLVNRK